MYDEPVAVADPPVSVVSPVGSEATVAPEAADSVELAVFIADPFSVELPLLPPPLQPASSPPPSTTAPDRNQFRRDTALSVKESFAILLGFPKKLSPFRSPAVQKAMNHRPLRTHLASTRSGAFRR